MGLIFREAYFLKGLQNLARELCASKWVWLQTADPNSPWPYNISEGLPAYY